MYFPRFMCYMEIFVLGYYAIRFIMFFLCILFVFTGTKPDIFIYGMIVLILLHSRAKKVYKLILKKFFSKINITIYSIYLYQQNLF